VIYWHTYSILRCAWLVLQQESEHSPTAKIVSQHDTEEQARAEAARRQESE